MSETIEVGKYKVILTRDDDVQSPREDGDINLFLVANHRSFYVPPPGMKRCPESANEVVDTYKKTHWVFPLEAYIHSGVRLALSGEGNFPDRQWDVSQLGMVFAAKNEWRLSKSARKAALSLIETWNQYLSGDVWRWEILDEGGTVVDSCCGCFGEDDARKKAIECATRIGKV
jgi:hypothetical protein